MLFAKCFFEGNYMTDQAAKSLLQNMCSIPELRPDLWNAVEPIDKPFDTHNLSSVIRGFMVPSEKKRKSCVRTVTFFTRRTAPRFLTSIDLRLSPVQWSSAHNVISFHAEEEWPGGAEKLAKYLLLSVLPRFPDYAKIVESRQEDPLRLQEFQRPMAATQFLEFNKNRRVVLPFGPYGCLEDVYWFNYFGKAYVDFIGSERLLSAGWARVDRVGDGLACYATATIDDASARQRRSAIASRLEEFVWSPGCEPKSKRIPVFEFSEQNEALRQITRQSAGNGIRQGSGSD